MQSIREVGAGAVIPSRGAGVIAKAMGFKAGVPPAVEKRMSDGVILWDWLGGLGARHDSLGRGETPDHDRSSRGAGIQSCPL